VAVNTLPSSQGGRSLLDFRVRSRPDILLDRDGTIIVDHGYVGSIDRVEFIDGKPEAIAKFNSHDPWPPAIRSGLASS
jgi:hypothetical protein